MYIILLISIATSNAALLGGHLVGALAKQGQEERKGKERGGGERRRGVGREGGRKRRIPQIYTKSVQNIFRI